MDEEQSKEKYRNRKQRQKGLQVQMRPTNFKLKFVSKEEFKEIRKRENIADSAAKEARQKSLSSSSENEPKQDTLVDSPFIPEDSKQDTEDQIVVIKKKISEVRAKLKANPKDVKAKKRMAKLEEELNQAEDALADSEQE